MRFRLFAEAELKPRAAEADRNAHFPRDLVRAIAKEGFLGTLPGLPAGGRAVDHVTLGLLNEAFGAVCGSARTLLTVHHMVLASVLRWGTAKQKDRWVDRLASGEAIGAFCLTERQTGSQLDAMTANVTEVAGGGYRVRAEKRWVSFGQYATVFLVFAKLDSRPVALLVPADIPGISLEPVNDLLGTRGSMVAHVTFDCELSADALLGPSNFGTHLVSTFALDWGRYSVGWGCVGLLRACCEVSASHASATPPNGPALGEHQLVRRLLTESFAGLEAARLICLEAARLRDASDPKAGEETFLAKYVASTWAARAASAAVQIHGALGCSAGHAVERFYRDAKVMEIIEGSTEIQQIVLGGFALRSARR
jgi:alkylation response protein AidB-like acyl-CoA dehydrogenase